MAGGGEGFGGVLGQAEPDLAGGAVHPAGGQIGRVEEVGLEARHAEGAGKLDAVVERVADRRVAAARGDRPRPGDEELAAAGGERGPAAPPHPANRQEPEQDEVDQRDQAASPAGRPSPDAGIPLARSAPRPTERGHACQGVGGQPDVGVDEQKEGMTGLAGEDPAGVLLAAPAGGNSGVGTRRTRSSVAVNCSTIAAVRSSEWSSRTTTSNSTPWFSRADRDGIADRAFLVPGGDQNGDWRESCPARGQGGGA